MDGVADGIIVDPAGLANSENTGSLANTGQNFMLVMLAAAFLFVTSIALALTGRAAYY